MDKQTKERVTNTDDEEYNKIILRGPFMMILGHVS